MASQIDPTKPETGQATTQSVRDNFQIAADEITALQNSKIKVPFSFGDSTPKLILANSTAKTILGVSIVIETAFDGVGAALSVGTPTQPQVLMPSNLNTVYTPAEFTTNPNKVITENIILTINPGSAPSVGAGFVVLNLV